MKGRRSVLSLEILRTHMLSLGLTSDPLQCSGKRGGMDPVLSFRHISSLKTYELTAHTAEQNPT